MPLPHTAALSVALHVSSFFALNTAHAQNLPSISLSEVGIPANVKALFQLAEQG